jgi:hypothetical protein
MQRKKLAIEIKKLKCPALFENVLWVAFFIQSGPLLLVNNPVFVESLCALLFFFKAIKCLTMDFNLL